MIKIIVVELERILFNLTGVKLPTLRKEWEDDAEFIQAHLDDDRYTRCHETYHSKSMFFSNSK